MSHSTDFTLYYVIRDLKAGQDLRLYLEGGHWVEGKFICWEHGVLTVGTDGGISPKLFFCHLHAILGIEVPGPREVS